jgi:flagellar basal-body rod protein FlgB
VDSITAIIVNKNLDGLAMRALATAENIANANSQGYRAVRVTFEDALRGAAEFGSQAVRRIEPRMVRDGAPQADIRLDQELATAAETSMRYSALITLLGRQMQISHLAIRGGQ